eukprot:m.59688 g.59688  ORF g.59688 m.59688 type:complete len:233 (-) comp11778_c0_seq6:804-1502(-)
MVYSLLTMSFTVITRHAISSNFASVWKAAWHECNVAVKKLKQSMFLLDEQLLEQFQAEVKFQRAQRHRHVVLFYGAGMCQNGIPFLVTEFLKRGSLRQVLDNVWPDDVPDDFYVDGVLPWMQRVGFALGAARGLEYLHGQSPPCMHRDVKSANFLVSDGWIVKVADFGTSRFIERVTVKHRHSIPSNASLEALERSDFLTTTTVGTLLWLSPEIIAGKPYSLSADVYRYSQT